MPDCVFCSINKKKEKVILEDRDFIAVLDPAPVAKGHTIIITKKHMISFFEMNSDEFARLYSFIEKVKKKLDSKYRPGGYNIGHNERDAPGRTIEHLHIHVIPKYTGDMDNPSGMRGIPDR